MELIEILQALNACHGPSSGVTCLRDAEAALALIRAFVGHLAEKE